MSFFFFSQSLEIILGSQCPFLFIDMQMKQWLFTSKEEEQQIFFIRASLIMVKFSELLFFLSWVALCFPFAFAKRQEIYKVLV